MGRRGGAHLPAAAASLALLSCALETVRAPPAWREADGAQWHAVRAALQRARASRPGEPWAAAVRVALREPRSRREVEGRGAVAVEPGRALRMILVGPAGATMLDAWVTPDRWRISVPPAGLVRRGTTDDPDDLPVGFLRWSFFRPLEGTLTAGSLQPDRFFLLRDGEARVEVRLRRCAQGELTATLRRVHGHAERIDECRAPGAPRPGDWVHYEDERNGLRVELAIESAASEPPSGEAFDDPDLAGASDAPPAGAAPAEAAR